MKKKLLIILLFGPITCLIGQVKSSIEKPNQDINLQNQKPELVWVNYDFVPGDRVIFQDFQENELNGEFPSRWELIKGLGVENAVFDNHKVIYFREGNAYIVPLLSDRDKDYLPEQFTIEFDAWFEEREYSCYYLKLYDDKNQADACNLVTVSANSIDYRGVGGSRYPGAKYDANLEGSYWRHISLSYNGRGLKIYLDDMRLINIPTIDCNPTGFTIGVPEFNSAGTKGINRFIKNIRIAEIVQGDNKVARTTSDLKAGQEAAKTGANTTDVLARGDTARMADKKTIDNAINPAGNVAVLKPNDNVFAPGEEFISGNRPQNWNIEWNNEDGLDFMAYASLLRAPYIQDVTSNSATVMWRVSIPKGRNPADLLNSIRARAWIATSGKNVTEGELYQTGSASVNKIEVYDVTGTYKYEDGVKYNHDVSSGRDDDWLNTVSYRPTIGLKVVFRNLQPSTIYHYRIKSEGITTTTQAALSEITMANDVYFRTAPSPDQNQPVSFIAMGDLGPGNENWPGGYSPPSFFYDVFDLFNKVARDRKPDMWIALGDIDNDTDGHPNAMDPFFFNLYNAYGDQFNPGKTSPLTEYAKTTSVKAFRKPPYTGILGGLPVYPTFGNHDICLQWDGSLDYFNKAYKGSFQLPSAGWDDASRFFNLSGGGYFYTFRYGKVIFISLGLPARICSPERRYPLNTIKEGTEWKDCWGYQQEEALRLYLSSLQNEIQNPDVWVVVFFHDHNPGYVDESGEFSKLLGEYGVDLVLMGHDHTFRQKTISHGKNDYRAVVIGTGGYGDDDNDSDNCHYPGFVFFNATGNVLEYWKYDTHRRTESGVPSGRDDLDPRIWEHCRIQKTGKGQHVICEDILNQRVD
ncbi:MAG: hypothetical protein GYA22_00695 [Bacteroidales bacterium]|nr:hypothetical protein [Bacteroidales bacterium]